MSEYLEHITSVEGIKDKIKDLALDMYNKGRTDERAKVIAKVANLKNEYTDACNMCTKTDCRACEINNFIEQLETIISQQAII